MGVGKNGRPVVQRVAGELAAQNHQWLVFPRRKLFLGRSLLGRDGPERSDRKRPAARLPLPFPWRRLFALLRGALPAPGHLHLRRTGIRAVAFAPDRVSETDAADGRDRALPDYHGHALADA